MSIAITPSPRTGARYVVGVVFLFHVIAAMSYLVREGRLSIVPIYDDVAYLVDGMKRLSMLDQKGIAGFLAGFWTEPAHAPLSSLTSTFGFLLTGGATWGPYLMNSLFVGAALVITMTVLGRLPGWSAAGIAVAMLASPLFTGAITEFRPDPVWGLMVGFSLLAMTSIDLSRASLSRLFSLGLLFGLAVLAKPTAAPASVAVLGTGFLMQLGLSELWSDQRTAMAPTLRRIGMVALGALVLVTPYFLASGREILSYVLNVMRTEADVWGTRTTLAGHLSYYLNRETGTMMLGWIWYLGLPIVLACAAMLMAARDRQQLARLAAILAAMLMAFAIVTYSQVKTPMIGSILYGVIVASVIWSLGQLAARASSKRSAVVLTIGALVFATQWHPRGLSGALRTNPAMLAVDQASKATFPVVLKALRAGASNVFVTVPGPVYDATLDYLARQQGVSGDYIAAYTWGDWNRFVEAVDHADVIVLSEAGMLGQALGGFNFPSVQFQPRLLELLRTKPEFMGQAVFTDSENRSVWVFVRHRS